MQFLLNKDMRIEPQNIGLISDQDLESQFDNLDQEAMELPNDFDENLFPSSQNIYPEIQNTDYPAILQNPSSSNYNMIEASPQSFSTLVTDQGQMLDSSTYFQSQHNISPELKTTQDALNQIIKTLVTKYGFQNPADSDQDQKQETTIQINDSNFKQSSKTLATDQDTQGEQDPIVNHNDKEPSDIQSIHDNQIEEMQVVNDINQKLDVRSVSIQQHDVTIIGKKQNFKKIRKQKKDNFAKKSHHVKQFQCEFCDRVFQFSQSLGGHISRAHPGMSKTYVQKMKVRNSRVDQRETLEEAKLILNQKHPEIKRKDKKYHQLIKQIRKDLIEKVEEEK